MTVQDRCGQRNELSPVLQLKNKEGMLIFCSEKSLDSVAFDINLNQGLIIF